MNDRGPAAPNRSKNRHLSRFLVDFWIEGSTVAVT
jgi:hypothetical protein